MERLNRVLVRVGMLGMGGGAGIWIGLVLYYVSKPICAQLGLRAGDPTFRPNESLDSVVNFTLLSAFLATFAAGSTSAYFAPPESKYNDLIRPAVWSAAFGLLAGGWLGASIGSAVLLLVRNDYLEASQNLATLLAAATGIVAGIAATLGLRFMLSRK